MSINRVVTNTPSVLFGTLSSNGKVVLVNQSGIAVGAGAQVDTAGFTASAVAMSDQDSIAGRLRFGGANVGSEAGALTVQGNIIGRGGDVVLIAPSIELAQSAVVESHGGSVLLAAGRSVEVTGRGLEGISMQVQAPTDQAVNLGTLKGDAVGIFAGTLKHSGLIQANQASVDGGKVMLKAAGDAFVEGSGKIVATSASGKGGSVSVLGNRVALTDNAQIDVSGATGGGTVLVGGDYQGKNPDVQNSLITYLGKDTRIQADATENGDGGKVIIWADDTTRAYGNVSARGGESAGNGGFVETSGHRYLDFRGRTDTGAPRGEAGKLLLDPTDIHIIGGTTDTLGDATWSGGFLSGGTVNPQITWNTINGQVGNVEIRTNSASTSGQGDIWIDASGVLSGPTSLTLLANRGLNFQGFSLNAGSAAVNLVAGWNNSGWAVSPGPNNNISFGTGSSVTTTGNIWMNAGNAVTGPTAIIHANSLTIGNTNGGSLPGGVNLPGANMVNTLAIRSDSVTGSLTFNNGQALTVGAGQFSIGGIVATGKTAPISIATSAGAQTIAQPIVTAGNLTLQSPAGIGVAANMTVGGTLGLTSTNANVSQSSGTIVATGATTVSAGSGDILLGTLTTSNDFSTIQLSGGSVQVVDTNAMNVALLTSGANKQVTLVAGGALTTPFSAINTGSADLQLSSGTTLNPNADLTGNNVKLAGTAGVDLEFNVTANGTLLMSASGTGAVTQNIGTGTGVITAAGATTINAGSGGVTLGSTANNFSSIGVATTGGVTLKDTNALVLNAVNGSGVTITTGGALTQSAGVVSTTGTLNTTTVGGTSLTNTNTVRFLIANNTGTGSFSFNNSGTLDLSINNSPSTGTVLVQNTGDLGLLNTGVVSGASGDAVKLVTSGNFLNSSNYPITLSGGVNPRWLIYSTSPSSNVVGATLSAATDFQQYGTSYPTGPAQATGNGLIYSGVSSVVVPVTTLVNSVSKTYDGTTAATLSAANYSLTPTLLTDPVFGNVTPLSLTVSSVGSGTYGSANAGSGISVSSSGGTVNASFSGKNTYGYALGSSSTAVGSISPLGVVFTPAGSLVGTTSKTYDGTTVATLSPTNFSLAGFIGSDSATVTKTTGAYASQNVGTGILVSTTLTPADFSPAGSTLLSNYSFPTAVSGNIGAITPRSVAAGSGSLVGTTSKVYDGTTVATLSPANFALTGFVGSESASVTKTTGTYASQNVGTGILVSTSLAPTDFSPVGSTLLSNYSLPTSASGNIGAVTERALAPSLAGTTTKVYDATTVASLSPANFALTGFVGGESASVTKTTGTYASPNVGTGILVSTSLAPADFSPVGTTLLSNYSLPTAVSGNIGNITQQALVPVSGSLVGTTSKVYDGTTLASLSPSNFSLIGFVGSESATVTKTTGTYASQNVGTAILVNASLAPADFSPVGSTLLSNYSLPTSASGNIGTITQQALIPVSGSLVGTTSKVYDGTTLASLSPSNFSLTGFVGSESATVTKTTGTYASQNVGTGILVATSLAPTDFTPVGSTLLSNYSLPTTVSGNIGTITPAEVVVTPVSGSLIGTVSKAYDGTTVAVLSPANFALTGFVGSDSASVTKTTGTYASQTVGAGILVSASLVPANFTPTGSTQLSNYSLPTTVSGKIGTITQRPVSTWTGAVSNIWSAPGNWDALPIGDNVAGVSIPAGSAPIIFDSSLGSTTLQSLTSGRPVQVTGGILNVVNGLTAAGFSQSGGAVSGQFLTSTLPMEMSGGTLKVQEGLNTAGFTQTGGTISGAGTFKSVGGFNQTGGSVSMSAIDVVQGSGGLIFSNLNAPTVSLVASNGSITEVGEVVTGTLTTSSVGGTSLNGAGNRIANFNLSNSGSGAIELTNFGVMNIQKINNTGGNIIVSNTGGVTTFGAVTAPAGSVFIKANSPLTIGAGGVSSSGNIDLTATNLTSSGDILLDGPINSSAGAVNLNAANNLTQNATVFGALGVNANVAGAITFGPNAKSGLLPVSYLAGGVPVAPPPNSEPTFDQAKAASVQTNFVTTFLDKFEVALQTQSDERRDKDKTRNELVVEGEICRP
jgi:hypothetical protein